LIDPNAHDRFVLRQKFTWAINRYVFSIPDGVSDGEPFCLRGTEAVQIQGGHRLFRRRDQDPTVDADPGRQRFDPKARYDITTAAGQPSGRSRSVRRSISDPPYALFTPDGQEICRATEKSLRSRCSAAGVELVPYLGACRTGCPSRTTSCSSGTAG